MDQRRNDRDFLLVERRREGMFFEDGGISPAARPIKLGHHGHIVLDTNLVDPILVTVQREKTSVAGEAHVFERCNDVFRLQIGKRQCGRVAHDTFWRDSRLRSVSVSNFLRSRSVVGVTSSNSSSSRNSSDCSSE